MALLIFRQVLHLLIGVFCGFYWFPNRLFYLPLGRCFVNHFYCTFGWDTTSFNVQSVCDFPIEVLGGLAPYS